MVYYPTPDVVRPSGDTSGATDYAAIQAGLNSFNNVSLAKGTYYINKAITLVTAGSLQGAGIGQTIITQVSTTQHGITAVDASQLTIRDLLIGGPGSGTGNGINITLSSNTNSAYNDIENVVSGSFGNCGVYLNTPIVTHLRRVIASTNGGDGFQLINTAGTPTSVTFESCYARANAGFGYELDSAAYCVLNACASDSNPVGYALFSCQGVVLNGCGTEKFTTAGWVFDACTGCHLNGGRTFDGSGIVVHVQDGTTTQTITGLVETSPHAGATASIQTETGTSSVITNPTVITATNYAADSVSLIRPTSLNSGHFQSTSLTPTAVAGGNNGTSPPAPVIVAGTHDSAGNITFGSGSGPSAGSQVSVTFGQAWNIQGGGTPHIVVTANNSATQALGMYITSISPAGFILSTANAPAASQANSVYNFSFVVIG